MPPDADGGGEGVRSVERSLLIDAFVEEATTNKEVIVIARAKGILQGGAIHVVGRDCAEDECNFVHDA